MEPPTEDEMKRYRLTKEYASDNFYYLALLKQVIWATVVLSAIIASCHTAVERNRMLSPGYRYHEVEVRLDDDNSQNDSIVIHGAKQ